LLNEPEVQHVMNMAQHADIAMVGIGSLKTSTEFEGFGYKSQKELDLLKKRGAVGEMHGEYFNSVGEPLELQHHHRLISIRLETLRKMKHVVGVAGGADKIEALQAALKGGFIHSLITDEMTAGALLPSS
jgi:DNA-binding transcriptional regulator LsrR (DeoR family)